MVRAMSKLTAGSLAALLLALAGAGAWSWKEAADREARAAEREAREEREAAERAERQRDESRGLMPPGLERVALGMTAEEIRATGLRIHLATTRQPDPSEHLEMYEAELANGAEVLLGFSTLSSHLVQVQIMSLLPRLDAIAPHLMAMNERYGTPTGIYDCPDTQGLPTRRFTWRRSQTAIADVFLVYGGRASLTLYIATPETIGASLARSRCGPVPRERLDQFPVATPEQVQAATASGM